MSGLTHPTTDFETEIRARVAATAGAPRVWGKSDCLMWIADIHVAVLGLDPAAAWRGRYRTERGARRVLGRAGVAGALETCAAAMGWREIAPGYAAAGDVGLIDGVDGPAGVIFDGRFWIGKSDRGFDAALSRMIARAWGWSPGRFA